AEALSLAVGGVWEGRDLDLAAVLLCLLAGCFLGVAEGCDLRVAEGGARHHLVVAQLLGLRTSDGLCRDDTLCLSDVGQLQPRGDVADGVDVLRGGAHALVDDDLAALRSEERRVGKEGRSGRTAGETRGS